MELWLAVASLHIRRCKEDFAVWIRDTEIIDPSEMILRCFSGCQGNLFLTGRCLWLGHIGPGVVGRQGEAVVAEPRLGPLALLPEGCRISQNDRIGPESGNHT